MNYVYYEVYNNTPGFDDRYNECTNSELIGRWAEIEQAKIQMCDWFDKIGLEDFDEYYYEINSDRYDVGLFYNWDNEEKSFNRKLLAVAGLFYNSKDEEVSFTDNWIYARYVSIYRVEIEMGETSAAK